jgi:tRNA(Ile2)-agmatinylcytidine synthase
VVEAIEAGAEFECDNTNPGVVFHIGDVPVELKAFHDDVVQTIVSLNDAEKLIAEYCTGAVGWKNRRGLIGALAAIGGTLEGDHTYELLTYRIPENRGKKRLVDTDSVRRVEASIETFNSVDPRQKCSSPRVGPILYSTESGGRHPRRSLEP